MPDSLLHRYRNHEHAGVWKDIVALGGAVRHELYEEQATGVAAETMKRARHNVESIIVKLDKLGYSFTVEEFDAEDQGTSAMFGGEVVSFSLQDSVAMLSTELERITQPGYAFRNPLEEMMAANANRWHSTLAQTAILKAKADEESRARQQRATPSNSLQNSEVFSPAGESTAMDLMKFESQLGGPLPLSLFHWYLHVGAVNLSGWHETLRPVDGSVPSDPLWIGGFREYADVYDPAEQEENGHYVLEVAPEAWFELPDPAADVPFHGGASKVTFVEHLREAFLWGGFPGFARRRVKPPKELDYLKEGLLPL